MINSYGLPHKKSPASEIYLRQDFSFFSSYCMMILPYTWQSSFHLFWLTYFALFRHASTIVELDPKHTFWVISLIKYLLKRNGGTLVEQDEGGDKLNE